MILGNQWENNENTIHKRRNTNNLHNYEKIFDSWNYNKKKGTIFTFKLGKSRVGRYIEYLYQTEKSCVLYAIDDAVNSLFEGDLTLYIRKLMVLCIFWTTTFQFMIAA